MRHEIQVHFQNAGQVLWHEEIDDVENWLAHVMEEKKLIAFDEDTERHYGMDMSTVTAIIISPKKKELDIWSRTYASSKKADEENPLVDMRNKAPY